MQINGKIFLSMAVSAANLLENRKEEINNLNVFPVPDGDTGVNMCMTLGSVRTVMEDATLSECAEQIANRVLRSARGNSGAILSLFFRGFSKAVRGLESADSEEIAMAFARGKSEAYKAVKDCNIRYVYVDGWYGTSSAEKRTAVMEECAENGLKAYVMPNNTHDNIRDNIDNVSFEDFDGEVDYSQYPALVRYSWGI